MPACEPSSTTCCSWTPFDTVSKDSLLYPKWGSGMATSAREETLRTVIGLALHDNGDIRDLMTTRQTYIDRRLAVLYRVPFPFTGDWVKYEFPAIPAAAAF
jgi:hypothetical protein